MLSLPILKDKQTIPIYEFRCKKCKNVFEGLIFSPAEEKKLYCPECGAKNSQKIMSVFAGEKSNCSTYSSTTCSPSCSSGYCH
jgi:putative regulatory protein, FmdB family